MLVIHRDALPRWKRALDLLCCLIALPVFLICTLFMAVLMRIAAPGPIFFRQERVGLRGSRFRLYKFRTMQMGADSTSHQNHFAQSVQTNSPMQKLDARGDPRLIPGAWLIRSAGLDELPQIVNVMRGEMSIVGPRPCIPYEYELYSEWQRTRFNSTPGLTGLWQVSGKNRTTFEQMVQLDRAYSERKSLFLDLWIIARTVPAICIQIKEIAASRLRAKPRPQPEVGAASHATTSR